jgi:hypothetical protein
MGGRIIIAGALTAQLLAACSTLSDPSDVEALVVEARPPSLILTNRADRPVFYRVFEREHFTTALILWAPPCADPDTCPRVDPAFTVTVPYDDIIGYETEQTEAIVHWWFLVPEDGGTFAPDSIRAIDVIL